MDFKLYLAEHLKKHPSMQPRDVVKMCYQAALGAEHLLTDLDRAREYFNKELDSVEAASGELYEMISDEVCRVDLSSFKAKGLPPEWLFRMFVRSCRTEKNSREMLREYLSAAEEIIADTNASFTAEEWREFLREYEALGMPPVHHSEEYRLAEHPSYRIADSRFCRVLPILEKLGEHQRQDKPLIIAIDGRAASGKTTLSLELQYILDADVIHMDDFFVPPHLRSRERFSTPGENIHYERFAEEVLPYIQKNEVFSYRVFDCSIMDFRGMREIGNKPFRIVEGSYSCHPKFGSYADITVFSDVPAEEQIIRIRKRNGEAMLEMFQGRWIPMEEEYFSYYSVKDRADITV